MQEEGKRERERRRVGGGREMDLKNGELLAKF
jgi:hypothetical protein